MAIAGVPEIIHSFNMYKTGNRLVGITGEVALPNFESSTSTTGGAGILGEYEAIAIGHYGSMEQVIPFRCIDEDFFTLISPSESVELTLRGSIQRTVRTTLNAGQMGMRVVYRGRCKNIAIGTVRLRRQMDSQITLELTYIYVEMDGKPKIELDKINEVFKINGVDMLADVKRLT